MKRKAGNDRPYRRLAWLAGLVTLAACGERDTAPAGPPPLTAATLGDQDIKPVAVYLREAPYATADAALGDRLLLQCRSCHNLEAGAGHTLGPNLHGMFGRRVGGAPGFGYTRALSEADFVWTPRALDAWLEFPQRFLPGNAMAWPGMRNADDRAALIASLMRRTDTGEAPASGGSTGN